MRECETERNLHSVYRDVFVNTLQRNAGWQVDHSRVSAGRTAVSGKEMAHNYNNVAYLKKIV